MVGEWVGRMAFTFGAAEAKVEQKREDEEDEGEAEDEYDRQFHDEESPK
jgi:hypothetical protein